MASTDSIQAFPEFVQSVSSARFDDFRLKAETQVESDDAFERMRRHLLDLYEGVEVQHSFIESGGQVVDCIPVEQQPSLRNTGRKASAPPPLPESYETEPEVSRSRNPAPGPISKAPPPQLHPSYRDRFGNQMWCPEGTIPMVRLSLEQMCRFKNLKEFFRKAPLAPDSEAETKELDTRKYRYATAFQSVLNIGGFSWLNVWKPTLGANQNHSLSQLWFVGGSGAARQTVECGWRVYRGSPDHPRLFIYWTADNYNNTGCYDLTCKAFVVPGGGSSVIGAALQPSQPGVDNQVNYRMGFALAHGEWWFYLNNEPVGYYPIGLFNGGALTSSAGLIDSGGEVNGNATWSPMGSGAFGDFGYGIAAYHRDVVYSPPGGGLRIANLSPHEPSPQCFKVRVTNSSHVADWNTYLFFGGPGGTNC